MSYQDRFGVTNIRPDDRDNLDISFDYDDNPSETYPVFLFTPDMKNPNDHYHITLSLSQAQRLHQWLTDYLAEKER